MGKFLKTGKVVIMLNGRYAGKKAVIVKNYDDGAKGRRYGHALVCGLAKEPRKVTKRQSEKAQKRKATVKTFIKITNYNHLMPTRYSLDVDLAGVVTPEALESPETKVEARKKSRELMEEKFKTGKNRWFFSKLKF
eukprot:TRINITY_DN4160_c0_g1_i1.p2 TRINITY_DN4160_c0_g1~~TRINITY_DN4160_c0_g1_i1.p2  ORF type:complete len:136 (-),score=18.34 TRINITY_DN4160_c0_g1_i1:284-691(-)